MGGRKLLILVALPGLEPGLFALRGRRVNQLHHNAMNGWGIRCDLLIIAKMGWRRGVIINRAGRRLCSPMSQNRDMGHPHLSRIETGLEA
jgi:hypothetical protein